MRSYTRLLSKGAVHWNRWRRHHPNIKPDLSSRYIVADLKHYDLEEVDLRGTYLRGCNLQHTSLMKAVYSPSTRWPSPTMFLLADWEGVSDELTLALMRYDASNHPNPRMFLDWGKGGPCPYEDCRWQRSAQFFERRGLIKPSFLRRKVLSAYELAERLLKECLILKEGWERGIL